MDVGGEQLGSVVLVPKVVNRLCDRIAQVPVDVDAGFGLPGQVNHSQHMRGDETDDGDLHVFNLFCVELER